MTQEESENITGELGCFRYTENGFNLVYRDFSKSLEWNEITEIIAFKTDLLTNDRIDLQIVYGEKYFTISEDLPGWHQFILKLKNVFPTISNTWDTDIMLPAFAENKTILYTT
ncbi:hypothetical protein [Flavobacterium filum]|uniref:hypothetical protein n=1 Tax=Flavobacterium filum TaxID=370974 RepID=UPI0023F32108|nr:hypothetical protein [Flavobacterium filum]